MVSSERVTKGVGTMAVPTAGVTERKVIRKTHLSTYL